MTDANRDPAAPGGLPYRSNVGAVLFNREGLVFIARRADLAPEIAAVSGWQFPQGGIDDGEEPRQAVLRELREEIGTGDADVIGEYPDWLSYDFPQPLQLGGSKAAFRGQRQRWFALRFQGSDADIRLDQDAVPEFDAWRWIALQAVPELAVEWKRPIYAKLARAFAAYQAPADFNVS